MIWSIYNCSFLKSLHQSSKIHLIRKEKKNIFCCVPWQYFSYMWRKHFLTCDERIFLHVMKIFSYMWRKHFLTCDGNICLTWDENIFLTWDGNISLQFYRTDRQITLLGNWCSCPRANILHTMSPKKYLLTKSTNSFYRLLVALN